MLSETNLQAGFSKIWSVLTGQPSHLLSLTAVHDPRTVTAFSYAGRQTVPLSQIRGSASLARCTDFDANFRPLKDHLRTRWQRITAARQRGAKLPPVALIRIGDVYFVEDGHHRISVAKTRGEPDIEAEVVVWQTAGSVS